MPAVHPLQYITLTPLAGGFIQSDLQCIQGAQFVSEYMPHTSHAFLH